LSQIEMRVLLLVAASLLGYVGAQTPTEVLNSAMTEAIKSVMLINDVAETLIGEDFNPVTQRANGDSIAAQKVGDIMQATTKLIIDTQGAAFLSKLKGIDTLEVLHGLIKSNRTKRQYGGGTSTTGCIEQPSTCNKANPYRSISGWCNHDDTANRALGSASTPIRRFMGAPKYDDGFNSVRRRSYSGGYLPSARDISNKIFAEAAIPSFDPKYNHLLMQFGQWIAHDIIFTPLVVGPTGALLDCTLCQSAMVTTNCAPIEVPENDAYFPTTTDTGDKACIRLTRAINGQTALGVRTPINQNSHFLDLSQVYGSTDCVARELRTLQGGMMKMYTADVHNLPPQNTNQSNCNSQRLNPPALCFNAGDSRNSLHPGLITLHTIYLRQHNRWAEQIQVLRPTWNDNQIYQETRRLMIALYQSHVYSEYLPKIIGEQKMQQFNLNPSGLKSTYDPYTDPSVSVEFCTGAFRFGHSQVRKDIPRIKNNNVTVGSYIDLGQHIFYTDPLYDRVATVNTMTQGAVNCPGMAVDRQFSFPMRNEMFSIRGKKASGVDMPAFNVQRAREKGVQPYNEVRQKIPGLGSVSTFDALEKNIDKANIDLLKKTYEYVHDVDLYVGLLMERVVDPTALLGPTGTHLIADQFSAFKKGDRFFYENSATGTTIGGLKQVEYDAITNYSLAQLICENTYGMEQVQADIFQFNNRKVQCSSFQPFPILRIIGQPA
ncbi:hypothetical protein PENTCL1PPCAC_3178, partial [Pristionchus entomophagus]